MSTQGRPRIYRIVMYAVGLLTCAVLSDGWIAHAVGAATTVVALVLYALDDARGFRVVLMWCAGFLTILAPEGLSDGPLITRLYGDSAYDTASRCIVLSHLAVLLGHDLTFKEQDVAPVKRPWILSVRVATPLLVIGWLLTMAYLLPTALLAYQGGRAQFDVKAPATLTAIAEGLSLTTRIVVPIAAVWIAKRSSGATRLLMFGMAASVFLLGIASGVRFLLLFSVVGSAIVWMVPRPPSRKTFAVLLLSAFVLLVASRVLSETRAFGMRDADVGGLLEKTSPSDLIVMSEKSVASMSQAVLFARHHGYTNGRTSAALLVFWVPRAMWPEKPTLIGYWLPREFGHVDPGFSAAPAFTGATYVDFGLWGSVVLWFIGGLCFGRLELIAARICATADDARVLLIAPLYGGAYFAVRSPDTATLTYVGVAVSFLFLLVVAGRRRLAVAT